MLVFWCHSNQSMPFLVEDIKFKAGLSEKSYKSQILVTHRMKFFVHSKHKSIYSISKSKLSSY